jgi:hypothetical protein
MLWPHTGKYLLLSFIKVLFSCKIIFDQRFRGAYCLHHQGWVSLARKDRSYIGVQWTGLANREWEVDNYFTRQYIPEDNSDFLCVIVLPIVRPLWTEDLSLAVFKTAASM